MREINGLLRSPIRLPLGRVGAFEIKHNVFLPANGPVAVVSMREAFLTGRRPVAAVLSEPLVLHELVEHVDDGERVWMTDEPQELRQAGEWILSARPRGRVLVGGLGLGVVASFLAALPEVDHVEVVEQSPEVIDLVAKHQAGYTVRQDDIASFLRSVPEWRWDYAFLDTWQGTGEREWWATVMPLRRIIANRFGRRRVACWAEPIMLGQIEQQFLMSRPEVRAKLGLPADVRLGWYYVAFPPRMSRTAVRAFTQDVGLPAWERRFGRAVDEGIRSVGGIREVVAANPVVFRGEEGVEP